MNNITDKEIRIYCIATAKHCPSAFKKSLKASLYDSINAYIEEQPYANIDDITEHFGTPEQFAREFLDAMPADKRQKAIHKNTVIRICAITATVIITASVIIATILIVQANKKSSASYAEIYTETVLEEG